MNAVDQWREGLIDGLEKAAEYILMNLENGHPITTKDAYFLQEMANKQKLKLEQTNEDNK